MITVIGCDGGPLSETASARLARATLLVGGERQLSWVDGQRERPGPSDGRRAMDGQRSDGFRAEGLRADGRRAEGGVERVVLGDLPTALRRLATHRGPAAVLASGDPGFFGIVRALRRAGLRYEVLPAVSSVALAFARIGEPWDDAVVVSAHGSTGGRGLRRAVNACLAYPKVAVLTGPGAGPAELAAALPGRRIVIASRLGHADERVGEYGDGPDGGPGDDSGSTRWPDPNVALVLSDMDTCGAARFEAAGLEAARFGAAGGARWVAGAAPGPGIWALPESSFAHRDAMVTKAEVRALVLARLGPCLGDLVWDVGAGSGSVAVECARLGAAAIAVERHPDATALIAANARAHRVPVHVVAGAAPAALADLPDPDAVFVGGGGLDVLAACAARRPSRLVAAFAAVERIGPALAALSSADYRVDGTQLQASRLTALPDGSHRLAATNPVTVVWGETP